MISIITVCHNSGALLEQYVSSFLAHHDRPEDREIFEFILVENSGDNRTETHAGHLRESGFDAQVKMTENRGFGTGCNEGAALAKGDLIVLVNPDIVFTSSLAPLETAFSGNTWGTVLQKNPGRGLNVLDLRPEYRCLLSEITKVYRWLYRLKPLYRFAYPVGSFFVVQSASFSAVGGFDERFFLYYEEAELSRRLTARFGPPRLCREVTVLHEAGGTQPSSDFMLREEARGMVLYARIIGKTGLARRRLANLRLLARLRPALNGRAAALERALQEEGST